MNKKIFFPLAITSILAILLVTVYVGTWLLYPQTMINLLNPKPKQQNENTIYSENGWTIREHKQNNKYFYEVYENNKLYNIYPSNTKIEENQELLSILDKLLKPTTKNMAFVAAKTGDATTVAVTRNYFGIYLPAVLHGHDYDTTHKLILGATIILLVIGGITSYSYYKFLGDEKEWKKKYYQN